MQTQTNGSTHCAPAPASGAAMPSKQRAESISQQIDDAALAASNAADIVDLLREQFGDCRPAEEHRRRDWNNGIAVLVALNNYLDDLQVSLEALSRDFFRSAFKGPEQIRD